MQFNPPSLVNSVMLVLALLSVASCDPQEPVVDSLDPPESIDSITISPTTMSLVPGASMTFSATGMRGDSAVPVSVAWSATGGTITAAGVYSADTTLGTYWVVAAQQGGTLADTSTVTVAAAPPTLDAIEVSPRAITLAPGAGQQFSAVGRMSDNTSSSVSVSWTATGGSINAAGHYTAGNTAGTFRVIAVRIGDTRADTAQVTIATPPPGVTLTAIELRPASVTLARGKTQQFSAVGRMSDNSTTSVAVTYAATGGTVTSTGWYTAGSTAGTYRVIAVQQGGTRADTSVVTIPVPAPTLTRIEVSPATATVAAGETQQFSAVGRLSDNTTTSVAVTWSETGGTITTGGLYTAGSTAGTYRVIAVEQGGTRADTSAVTVTVPPPTLSSVVLTPATVSLAVGAKQQFTAAGKMSDGSTSSVTVTYAATGGTMTTGGLYTAGSTAGSFRVIATQQGGTKADTSSVTVTASAPTSPAPPANGVADPTLLPSATGQRPMAGTYGRSLGAGQTYVDPNTGVTVLKLTSSSVPAANSGMSHGYSEGGPNISQPWTGTDGQTYYTAKVDGWLVDVRYGTLTTSNWRRQNSNGEIGFAFSLNPATPRIAYVVSGKRVDRFNTATNQVENTGGWPWVITAAGDYADWLQTQVNDTWLTLMLNSNHTVVSFRPSDGLQRVTTEAASGASIDEPHLDREFPVVYLSTNNAPYNKIVNLGTGTYTSPADPNGINADDHAAPLRGRIVSMSWTANGAISVDRFGVVSSGPIASPVTDWSGDWHMAGQWVFNNPNQYFAVDQWADTGNYPIYKGMIGLVSTGNDKRLLAAFDGVGTGYGTGGQSHMTLAPDGKFVMWTSNMNGSGRFDVFLARVPVR